MGQQREESAVDRVQDSNVINCLPFRFFWFPLAQPENGGAVLGQGCS